jgi:two-component system sensor histidine kinase DegS
LVGFFAQQRANYEERLRQFETQAERHTIARSLHDSFVQSLAGINLRLESCQELLRRGRLDDASNELHALQQGVNCEYDRVREFIRSLTERESTSKGHTISANPHVTARLAFSVDSWTAERIFQIAIEAVRNARKHSQASHVDMRAAHDGHNVSITISDNGVGFPSKDTTPWSIASHVAEAGGHLIIAGTGLTRLELSIPA